MSSLPTPHIAAKNKDAFAKTVLMPGDPLRSKYIAENFLENPVLVNNTRGGQGYTGFYKGKKVSVMASGMGIPSIGIYSYELFNFYDVETIIRVGSAGAISPALHLRDIVFGMGACTNSNYVKLFGLPGDYSCICSFELLRKAVEAAEKKGLNYHVGNILSSDMFYNPELPPVGTGWDQMGVLAVEMESAALYSNAAYAGVNALCILTVSDSLITGEVTTAEERQNTFTNMMEVALELV